MLQPVEAVTPDVLDLLVKLLVEAAQPRQIILFGSYARGEETRDSDLDVLVIVDDVTNRLGEMVRLRRVLAPIKTPIDVLVYSWDEVRTRGQWPGTALYEALQEGRSLYGG